MILLIISFLLAFSIAFGRHTAVFGKVKQAIWFFSHFEKKRLAFTSLSIIAGIFGFLQVEKSILAYTIISCTIFFILFAFFFDMKYFFPEINKVEKDRPSNLPDALNIIGLTVNNESVAYPLDEVVIPRHIINDEIGGEKVLISYCALCISALAFSSKVGNENFYFRVAGVWRRNMIVYDTKTYSLWQQATGECIYGKLKGSRLKLLSGENTTWGEWKKKKPKSYFASKCIEARKGYVSRQFMLKGIDFITPKITVPGFSDLTGLAVRETVFGIEYNGVSKAYPLAEVINQHKFEDNFNGKIVRLEFNRFSEYLNAMEGESGTALVVEKHWWLGWKEFHPQTEIWNHSA